MFFWVGSWQHQAVKSLSKVCGVLWAFFSFQSSFKKSLFSPPVNEKIGHSINISFGEKFMFYIDFFPRIFFTYIFVVESSQQYSEKECLINAVKMHLSENVKKEIDLFL